jgi:hypothetical protein
MAGLSQIGFLGGGGLSGLLAALITLAWGLGACLTLLGSLGIGLGVLELVRRGGARLREPRTLT